MSEDEFGKEEVFDNFIFFERKKFHIVIKDSITGLS